MLDFSKYFAFISLRKEAINKIQTHLQSRINAPSSDKILLKSIQNASDVSNTIKRVSSRAAECATKSFSVGGKP